MDIQAENEGPAWTQDDFIYLLAHLDFFAEVTPWDIKDRQQEILSQLETQLRGRYTTSDIEKRLWDEVKAGYMYPKDNFPVIFVHGSSDIPTLDKATRELVGQALAQIRFYTPLPPRSKSIQPAVSSERTTKGNSNRRLPIKGRVDKNRLKHRRSASRKKVHQTKPSSRKLVATSDTVHISVEGQSESPRSFSERLTVRSNPHLNYATTNSPLGCTVRRSARLSTSFDTRHYYEPSSSASEEPKPDDESTVAASSRMSTPSPIVPTPSNDSPHYEDLLWEIEHLRAQCQKAKEHYDNLQRNVRQAGGFYSLTQGVPSEMRAELEKRNLRIERLTKQVQQQAYLRPYLALDSVSENAPNVTEVFSTFTDLKNEFAYLLVIPGMRMLDRNLAYSMNSESDLGSLLLNIYGKPYKKEDDELVKDLLTVPVSSLIQALVGAAVSQWVFKQELQCLETAKTPLLHKYRDCIASSCGQDALKKIDTAAFQLIIEEETFKDVTTPRVASRHTQRLLHALHPLIEDATRSRTTSKLEACLGRILSLAVRVRSLTLVFEHNYEFIWPPSFSLFETKSMETEDSSTRSSSELIRLPLVPGFRFINEKNVGRSADIQQAHIGVKAIVML